MKVRKILNEAQQAIQQELSDVKHYYKKIEKQLNNNTKLQYERFMGHLIDSLKHDPSATEELLTKLKLIIGWGYKK